MASDPDCNILTITRTTVIKIDGDRAVLASIADVLDKLDSRRSADDEADRTLERDLARLDLSRREMRADLEAELRDDAKREATLETDRQSARDAEDGRLKAAAQAQIVQMLGDLARQYLARAFPETTKTSEGEPPAPADDDDSRDQTGAFLDFAGKTLPNKAGLVLVGVFANGDMSQVSAITSVNVVDEMLEWLASVDCVQAVSRGDADAFGVKFANRSFTFVPGDMIFQLLKIDGKLDDDADTNTNPTWDEDSPEDVPRQDPTMEFLDFIKGMAINKRAFLLFFEWTTGVSIEPSLPIRTDSIDHAMLDLVAAGRTGRPTGCTAFNLVINWENGQNVFEFKTTDTLWRTLGIEA